MSTVPVVEERRKVNLSALGDGIIILGLSIFILSLASLYVQSSVQNNSSTVLAIIIGLFAFGISVLLAGILKILHAFRGYSNMQPSTLKTAVVATAVVFLFQYVGFFTFFFRL